MDKSKQNDNKIIVLTVASVACLFALTIAMINWASAKKTNETYALTNQRIINILNTQSQQSGEVKLNVLNNKSKKTDNLYAIVNPKVAQISRHNFKLNPDNYYTEDYVYYAAVASRNKHTSDKVWDRMKTKDEDDLHLNYKRILMNAATGLNNNQILSHKKILANDTKFTSQVQIGKYFKNQNGMTKFSGNRHAEILVKNNKLLRENCRSMLSDILGSSYELNFTLAPDTIKIKTAHAYLSFDQHFSAQNHKAGTPISAPVKNLQIKYIFTATLPNKAGRIETRKISLTTQHLGQHMDLDVPARIVKQAKRQEKLDKIKAQNEEKEAEMQAGTTNQVIANENK